MKTFNQQFLRLVPSGRKLVIGIPFIWLFLFFMLFFFLVMKICFFFFNVTATTDT